MNVTLLSSYSHYGGAAQAALRLAEALARQPDMNVQMLVRWQQQAHPQVAPHQPDWAAKALARASYLAEKLQLRLLDKQAGWNFQYTAGWGGGLVHQHPAVQAAEVLNLQWIGSGWLSLDGLEALTRLQKPVVWTLHDEWSFTGGCHYSFACEGYHSGCGHCPVLQRPHAGDLSARMNARKATLYQQLQPTIVTPSKWLGEKAQASYLLQGARFHHIPYGVDTDRWQPIPQTEARDALGLPQDTPVLSFIAFDVADPRKGWADMQQVATQLRATEAGQQLHIITAGKPPAGAGHPHTQHLGLLSDQAKLNLLLAASDAFVIPSYSDNLPNVVLEAMASGTPVIGYPTGGIPDMIADGQTGLLCATQSADALQTTLRDFFVQQEAWPVLRAQARQRAVSDFSYAATAQAYLALYQELLSGGAAAAHG